MRIELTQEESEEIQKALILASEHSFSMSINWEIISKFLAKMERAFFQ